MCRATSLTVIFDVKQDLRRKARLVAGGHLVNSLDFGQQCVLVYGERN